MRVGETSMLQPEAIFASVPDQSMWLRSGVIFRVIGSFDGNAAAVTPMGMLTALKPGTSTIEATLGRFSTTAQVIVLDSRADQDLLVPIH